MTGLKIATDVDLMNNTMHDVGLIGLRSVANIAAERITINVTTPVQFDSFPHAVYRSAEYLVQFGQVSSYSQCKILVIHNGIDIGITEYAQVGIGNDIPYELIATFSGANLELAFELPGADQSPVQVNFSRFFLKD